MNRFWPNFIAAVIRQGDFQCSEICEGPMMVLPVATLPKQTGGSKEDPDETFPFERTREESTLESCQK